MTSPIFLVIRLLKSIHRRGAEDAEGRREREQVVLGERKPIKFDLAFLVQLCVLCASAVKVCGIHAAAFTGANVFASLIFNVALTLPLRPSSNFTTVSMNCSALPAYIASIRG